ncbi:MAG: hypothetical protein MJ227_03675 [Bacilli bacterium]|nr:hypothetical protein [Bacilli bacterium]
MNKKKGLLIVSLSAVIACVGAIAAFGGNPNLLSKSQANEAAYSLTFDKNHKVVDSQILTENGNNIWVKDGKVTWGENLTFAKGSYIQNLSALTGIKSVTIELVSGSVDVMHAYSEPSDLTTPMYFDETVTSTKTVEVDQVNVPNYVRVISTTGAVVKSVSINYSCSNETEPIVVDDVKYELEMGRTKGENVYTSIVKGGMLSPTSLKVVPDYDKSGDAALQLDIAKDIDKDLLDDDRTIRAFSVDLKDDNGVVENNDKYGFMGQLETTEGNTGWMNPLQWSADLGNGWRRFYYNTDNLPSVKVTTIKNLNIFFSKSRKNSSGDSLNYVYVDNVRLYETNIADLNKMKVTKSQDAFDITGCTAEENKIPTAVKFELQKLSGDAVRFFIGKSWSDHTSYQKVFSNMSTSESWVIAKALTNGWFEVTIDLFKACNDGSITLNEFTLLDIRNGDGNNATVTLGDLKFVYDYDFTMNPGTGYKFTNSYDVKEVEAITFDYYLDTEDDTLNSKFMVLTNAEYIGDFSFFNDGPKDENKPYNGITSEILDDGFVHVTMKIHETNRTSASFKTIAEFPNISQIKGVQVHGSWGAHLPIQIRNIEIVNGKQDLLKLPNLTTKVYADKLDHNPQEIVEITSGVSVTKDQTVSVNGGFSWKVTANVNEESWDWIVFGFENALSIDSISNLSLKFVNAYKWAKIRFFDEDFNLICEPAETDFHSNDWNSFGKTIFHAKEAKYFGVCLDFVPEVENVVYIDALYLESYIPDGGYAIPAKNDTFIDIPTIKINSGKKLVMKITNIVDAGDDLGFRIIQDREHTNIGYGKYCVETDYEVWNFGKYAGKWDASYTTGLSRVVVENTSVTITFDFSLMGKGRDGLDLPTDSVSCIYFKADIMLASCVLDYWII